MLLTYDSISTTSGATIPIGTVCGNCGIDERRLLHNVRHRGIFRRLCTSCVLRLHPQSFCPSCFAVYHPSPPPSGPTEAVTCVKCYSASHSSCVGPNPQYPYICPMCVSPNAPILVLKKATVNASSSSVEGKAVNNENTRVIDKRAAKILVAAATISNLSMSKAEMAAKSEAERRAREAALTRKRARQALEHMAALAAREKMKRNEALPGPRMGASMSRFTGEAGGVVLQRRDSYSNSRVGNISNGGGGGMVVARVEERNRVVGNGERVDGSSNDVLARALNAVELRENEKLGGLGSRGSAVLGPSSSNAVVIYVDELSGIRLGSSSNSDLGIHDQGGGSVNESVVNGAQSPNQIAVSEKVNNGVVLHSPKEDQMQGLESCSTGQSKGGPQQ